MAHSFKLPDLGEGLTEGEVARWHVAEGQEIAEDDPLVDIQTDKATVEIPSPYGGTVLQILVAEGEIAPVGTALVVIGEPGEAAPEPIPKPPPPREVVGTISASAVGRRIQATPLVRRIAQELEVDLASIAGSGPGGRILEEDVHQAAKADTSERLTAEGRREPIRGIRRVMSENMTRSHRDIPAVTWVEECDFSDVDLALLVPLTLKAVAESLQEYPELNARVEGEELVYLQRYDIGIAVATDDGLVVPVVRGCDTASLEELDADAKRLAEAARTGALKPEELRDGTFTITSAGKFAGVLVTPLINPPQVGILGIHRIDERAVVREGEVVVRRVGNVSVTFDHRVIYGKRAAEFGLAVVARLEAGLGSGSARP
jgi:pyruvate dehydrogenase E2 component (dihydrolipoamide acetyltransferase)